MYRPPKDNQAPSPPMRLKLPTLGGMPSAKQMKEQFEHCKEKRGSIIEQPWKTGGAITFNLMVQWDKGTEFPVWTLYEENGPDSKMHWSQTFQPTDIEILYDVVAMSASGSGGQGAKIPDSLKPKAEGAPEKAGGGGGGGLGGSFLGTRANNYSSLGPAEAPAPQQQAPAPAPAPAPNPATSYTSLPQQTPYSDPAYPAAGGGYPDPNYQQAAPYPDPSQMYPPAQPSYPPPQPAYPPPQPAYPPPGGYPPPQPAYPPPGGYPPPGYGYGGYPPPAPAYPPPAPSYPAPPSDSPWLTKTSETPAYNSSSSSASTTAMPPEMFPVKGGGSSDYRVGSESGTNILLGTLLFEAEFITQPTLDAALKLQDMVREGKISVDQAPEALKRLHTMGGSIDQYINKGDFKAGSASSSSGSSSSKSSGQASTNVAEQRAAFDLLQKAGLLKEDDVKSASQVRSKHGGDLMQILQAAGKLDQGTYKAATTCVPLIRDNKMKVEQCIIALNYCSRSRVDFDTALEEMGWPNPLK